MIDVRSVGNEVDENPTLPNGNSNSRFSPHIPLTGVSFADVTDSQGRSIVRPTSTIVSGTLVFDALNGRAVSLRPGEPLHLDGFVGELGTLTWDGQVLVANLHGTVSNAFVGVEARPRNLMPTLFEWLQARQGLWLLWGTARYPLTLGTVALRWLGMKL